MRCTVSRVHTCWYIPAYAAVGAIMVRVELHCRRDCSHGTLPSYCSLTSQGGRETERAARPQAGQGLRGMTVAERTFAETQTLLAWSEKRG